MLKAINIVPIDIYIQNINKIEFSSDITYKSTKRVTFPRKIKVETIVSNVVEKCYVPIAHYIFDILSKLREKFLK